MRWSVVCVAWLALGFSTGAEGQAVGGSGGERDGSVPPPPSAAEPWTLPPMALGRIDGPLSLDGRPDEAAWMALDALELVQHWPTFGGAMEQRSVVRVGYDSDFLWAAAWFYDDPDLIQGNSLRRDRWDGDDAFDLIIDSYNDDQTALKFTTTPLGVLLDDAIQNDAQPGANGGAMNSNWNTFWDAATSRTSEGWFAEVRIPLASLGFSVVDGDAVMGLIAARYIARKNEKHIFPAIPPDRAMADFMPSRARDVRLTGVSAQRPLWVTPYALAGAARIRDEAVEPFRAPETSLSREAGVDVKYGLSSNLTLDLTVNTDFAQVESDALETNLDRFGLFLPEKRQFFQERASTFDFDFGEGRLFHSRRVGLSDEGTPRRILGGARLAGRVGAWDVGLLSMQVGATGPWASENDAVARVRRALPGGGYAGGMLTSRWLASGGADVAVGLDGRWSVGRDLVTVQAAHTRNEGAADVGIARASTARIFWERRNSDGWAYDWDLSYSGPGYDPRLGFEFRHDFSAFKGQVQYIWQPAETSPVARARVVGHWRAFRRNADGVVESALGRARTTLEFRSGHWLNVAFNVTREDVAQAFGLAGAQVPAGTYDGANLFNRFELSRSRPVGSAFTLWGGRWFDGWLGQFSFEPWWRLSRNVTVGGVATLQRMWFPTRDQSVNADRYQLRVSAALDTRLSAEAFVQYAAASRAVSTNLRVRYRFAEGRDLFLVIDEARDLDDPLDPRAAILGRTDHRFLLKYSWAFNP